MNTKYTFKVNSLRTLTSPYKKAGEKDTESIYYLLAVSYTHLTLPTTSRV